MFADINQDKLMDVAVGAQPVSTASCPTGNGFGPAFLAHSDFSDANFWNQSVVYYGSL